MATKIAHFLSLLVKVFAPPKLHIGTRTIFICQLHPVIVIYAVAMTTLKCCCHGNRNIYVLLLVIKLPHTKYQPTRLNSYVDIGDTIIYAVAMAT